MNGLKGGIGAGGTVLRLAWANPAPVERVETVRAEMRLVAAAAGIPGRPIKLDLAIERHLLGHDGLSDTEFLEAFSGRVQTQ